MTDTDVDIQRVAMVLRVEADGARRPVGSGYLLSDGVVLTAGHVIKPEAAEYQLRFFGDRPDVPVRRRTRHPGLDVALLHHRRLGNDLPPVVLGRLPRGSGELPVRGIGFPEFAVDGRQVHSHSIHGEIILQSRHGDPEGLVHLRARDQPESGVGGTPWGGSSGTALFAGRALVGVFHGALPRAGSHSFLAVRADLLHERADDDFTQWLARAGVPVEPVEVAPPHKPSGHGLRWTLSHQELVEKELTEDPYLLEKHLAYVDPGLADGSAPRRLFADLRRRRTPEVLLTGGVGTGKSRTCMEVADLAAADGWTVLHALPGGEFTVQNLAEDLRAAPPGRVLLVIDHLERRRRLDFDDIQDSLRPQAARQGIELRILAALRTDRADRLGSGLDRLFREVPVRQDDAHLGAVARRIVTTVAVRAVARWGEQAVSEACGRHPVVALLGAGYIENGFLDGVSPDLTAPPRSDDLVKLLERRLRDDRFLTSTTPAPDAHAFEATPVSLPQLACAAAFAACPQPRPQVEYAVDGLLAKLAPKGTPQPPFDGRTLVDRLIGYGWLQHTGGGELDTLHDIVTDTFLRSVLVPATGLPRPEQVSALFGLHLRDRTGLTRLARHIDRLHGELTHDADRTQLSRLCADFVTERMPAIRHHLAPPQENVAAVLRTLLTSPPWLTALAAHWDTLIAPWLTGIQGSALDHWFLYDVLRQSGDRPPGLVVDAALDRLDEEAVPGRAGMLLSVLLQADGLTDARRGRLLAAVRRWLGRPLDSDPDERKAYNGFTPYVLGPALRYTDDAADWNRIVTQGLNRAGQRGGSLFLGPLLQRPQLTPGIRRLTLAAAVKWLASYSDTDAAGHVLGPLLSRTDLNRDADSRTQLGQAARHALDYVQPRIEARRARFVLAPLLRQVELTPKQATNARQTADRWLALHRADPVVADVLAALLARPDTPAELCHRAADRALTWLDDHPDRPGGGPLAEALLAAPDRLGPGQLGRVLAAARRWSAAGPESVADSPLLRLAADCETGPDGTVRRIVAEDLTDRAEDAYEELRAGREGAPPLDAGPLLLLLSVCAVGDSAPRLAALAVTQALDHMDTFAAGRVLRAVLRLDCRVPRDDIVCRALLYCWVQEPDKARGAQARATFEELAVRSDAESYLDAVLAWITERVERAEDTEGDDVTAPIPDEVLPLLLTAAGLGTAARARVWYAAQGWLDRPDRTRPFPAAVLAALLRSRPDEVPDATHRAVLAQALRGLCARPTARGAADVAAALLDHPLLEPHQAHDLGRRVPGWFDDEPGGAAGVCVTVAAAPAALPDPGPLLAEVHRRIGQRRAGKVLQALLDRPGDRPEVRARVRAEVWRRLDTGDCGQDLAARALLVRLVAERGLPAGEARQLHRAVTRWLGLHGAHAAAGLLLPALVDHDRDAPPGGRVFGARARAWIWLEAHGDSMRAAPVIAGLLATPLLPAESCRLVDTAVHIVEHHSPRAAGVVDLLVTVLELTRVRDDPELAARIAPLARECLRWHPRHRGAALLDRHSVGLASVAGEWSPGQSGPGGHGDQPSSSTSASVPAPPVATSR